MIVDAAAQNPLQRLGLTPEAVAATDSKNPAELGRLVQAMYRAQAGLLHSDKAASSTVAEQRRRDTQMAELNAINQALQDPEVLLAVREEYLRATNLQREVTDTRKMLEEYMIEERYRHAALNGVLTSTSSSDLLHVASAKNCLFCVTRYGSLSPDTMVMRRAVDAVALLTGSAGEIFMRTQSSKTFQPIPHKRLIGAIDHEDFKTLYDTTRRAPGAHPRWVHEQTKSFFLDGELSVNTLAPQSLGETPPREVFGPLIDKLERLAPPKVPQDPRGIVPRPGCYLASMIPVAWFRFLVPYFSPRIPVSNAKDFILVSYNAAPGRAPFFSLEGAIEKVITEFTSS